MTDIYKILKERENEFVNPEFWWNSNNGVIGICKKCDSKEIKRGAYWFYPDKNRIYTFSNYSQLKGCVTGMEKTLIDLVSLYEKTHERKMKIKKANIYVPFSNCGAHYSGEKTDNTPESNISCILPCLEHELKQVNMQSEKEVESKMKKQLLKDAFIFKEAIPKELKYEENFVIVEQSQIFGMLNEINVCKQGQQYRTKLKDVLEDFDLLNK